MSISEVKVGSLIRVKVGKNLILARVLEVLNDGFRVCSIAKNKEFNVPQSRVQFDGEQPAPANTEPQAEATAQSEQESAEATVEPEAVAQSEQEPAEPEPQTEQPEAAEQTEPEAEQPEAPVEAAVQEAVTVEAEPSTVEVVPEDEAAEFTPSGEDEEDEYAINPAHESDKPVKRMSLLSAAVEVLKAAGPEHPMNCKEILEAILERHLWTPTDCKTPEQTLYGSIFRKIATKEHPRIVRADQKGKFRIAE